MSDTSAPADVWELIHWLRKAAVSIYIATDEAVADDISPKLHKAADALARLSRAAPADAITVFDAAEALLEPTVPDAGETRT